MTNGTPDHDNLDVLAGEFVLSTLDNAQHENFALRLRTDRAARLAVAAARERFLELDLMTDRSDPPEALWRRIDASLTHPTGSVIDLVECQGRGASAATMLPLRAGFWRGFAAASVGAAFAACLAWFLVVPAQPRLIVVLLDAEARPVSIVEALDNRSVRVVPLGRIDVPSDKTLQVWTLPDPQTGPVSMGLLPSVNATRLIGPALPAPKLDQLYEITLEPAGGSPTGKPTGTVIGKGYARVPQI